MSDHPRMGSQYLASTEGRTVSHFEIPPQWVTDIEDNSQLAAGTMLDDVGRELADYQLIVLDEGVTRALRAQEVAHEHSRSAAARRQRRECANFTLGPALVHLGIAANNPQSKRMASKLVANSTGERNGLAKSRLFIVTCYPLWSPRKPVFLTCPRLFG